MVPSSLPRMIQAGLVGLCEAMISNSGFAFVFQAAFWRFRQFLVSQALPAIVDLQGAVFPLANQGFGLGGTVVAMLGLQLQQTSLVLHHPIVADSPFRFPAEDLAQRGGARPAPMVVLRLCCSSRQAPIV